MHLGAAWSEVCKRVELLIVKPRVERPSFAVKLQIFCSRRRPESGHWGKLGVLKGNNPDSG